jgi:hypothetical protein
MLDSAGLCLPIYDFRDLINQEIVVVVHAVLGMPDTCCRLPELFLPRLRYKSAKAVLLFARMRRGGGNPLLVLPKRLARASGGRAVHSR